MLKPQYTLVKVVMVMESNYDITNKSYQQRVHNTFKSGEKKERKPNQQSKKKTDKSKCESIKRPPHQDKDNKKGNSINKYI